MDVLNLVLTIVGMFVLIVLLDYVWLGIITKDFIVSEFGSLVKVVNGSLKIKLGFGLITWLIIVIGCFIFVVNPATTYYMAMIFGAIFGFVLYFVYDFTNLTFISNYPLKFVFVDVLWGTFLCFSISLFGFFIRNLLIN